MYEIDHFEQNNSFTRFDFKVYTFGQRWENIKSKSFFKQLIDKFIGSSMPFLYLKLKF